MAHQADDRHAAGPDAKQACSDSSKHSVRLLQVFRLSAQEHVLMVVQHHSITDVISLSILGRDLSAAYRAALHAASRSGRRSVWHTSTTRLGSEPVWTQQPLRRSLHGGGKRWQARRRCWNGRLTGHAPAPCPLLAPSCASPRLRLCARAFSSLLLPSRQHHSWSC